MQRRAGHIRVRKSRLASSEVILLLLTGDEGRLNTKRPRRAYPVRPHAEHDKSPIRHSGAN